MPENEYLVSWEIDIPADSPEQAVKTAIKWLKPKEPIRWAYQAQDSATGETVTLEGEDLF